MKFALAAYGSRGDVEPFAAVARELLRRGHDVCLAVPPKLLGFVESAGLAAVPFGSDPPVGGDADFAADTGPNPLGGMLGMLDQVAQAWAEWGTALTNLATGADLLVTGKGEQGLAANVSEYHHIPQAILHFFPEGQSSPGGVIGRIAQDAEDAQRRALNLPEPTESATRRAALQIHAYDPLCFPDVESPQKGVGALTLELPTAADDEVLSWIAAGTPPIYFGFGDNVRVPDPVKTVAVISAACAQLGERALICAGASDFAGIPHSDNDFDTDFDNDCDNVKIVGAVNHAAIFPACRAVVHHGGAGTTAAGMRAGVPTLILWFSLEDQPIWAATVERLKVGVGHQFSTTTQKSLVADLREILNPLCVIRAREIAAEMTRPAESVADTADLLEEAVRMRRATVAGRLPRVAILDDYAGVALDLADWSPVQARSEVTVFDRHLSEAEAAEALLPFDVICTLRERMALPRKLIERLPNLRLITIVGRNLPNLDLAAASEYGVLVAHSDFAHPRFSSVRDATPELAWGLMIATVRNLAEEHRRMRDGGWQLTTGITLSGKTLGLLGLGRIGKRMAEYAKVFGMEVIAWSQNLTEEAAAAAGARRVEKATLFEQSDVVSIHLVLSERTRGLIGAPELALMKPHAYLINTSRGPIVDEQALIAALKTGRIAGAGLDVYDSEPPPPDHPLRLLPNVTLSPHLGYVTREMLSAFYTDTVEAVSAWLSGSPIRIANPEAWQRGHR